MIFSRINWQIDFFIMIAYIKGQIKYKEEYLIVERQGIGYKVFVSQNLLSKKKVNDELAVFTHEYHKDDGVDLYGFEKPEELRFFEEMISVSGVGPKSGLAMLSQFPMDDIKKSIIHGDTSLLTKVSGIGKKTAERLILELKEKISVGKDNAPIVGGATTADEAIEALMALGYSQDEALAALSKMDSNLSTEEKVKAALQGIGGGQ